MNQYMYINDIEVAAPKQNGVSITDEPVWASNSGRSTTGKMIGDIVTWVTTISVTWPPLSFEEAKKIRDTIKNAGTFFSIKYHDFDTNTLVEKKVYASSLPRVLSSVAPGIEQYDGIAVTFTEQGGE